MTDYYEHKLDPVGVKPDWLADDDVCDVRMPKQDYWSSSGLMQKVAGWDWNMDPIYTIRIPADHWAVPALKAGFKPWPGGGSAPDDWDGGEVLLRYGDIDTPTSYDSDYWQRGYEGDPERYSDFDIIGYRPKSAEQVQPSAPALTEEMVRGCFWSADERAPGIDGVVSLLRERGMLAEPEPVDPIRAALYDRWPLLDTDALRETLAKHNLKIVEAA